MSPGAKRAMADIDSNEPSGLAKFEPALHSRTAPADKDLTRGGAAIWRGYIAGGAPGPVRLAFRRERTCSKADFITVILLKL